MFYVETLKVSVGPTQWDQTTSCLPDTLLIRHPIGYIWYLAPRYGDQILSGMKGAHCDGGKMIHFAVYENASIQFSLEIMLMP